ncbi:hypothetical protein BO94DRAFT_557714 [Aspergillus sclerotioniger CBS 115572]|uniref:Cell wall protein n=1 Tax=Aspergillus sclerotioniger CBS 115572 TaxID=1450535 RepID=A0A317WC07_9EURO|nr:hypothetical protein BO94DRAFT_557714 [Aspergillus sclerotioniger CBS 115572]PWY83893.1 hypothetical protein BO94DRAFT_557714 [Aspergillus sclerotioniger CBS 115572]
MKSTFALSALIASVLAAAAPTTTPFQLVISRAQSSTTELKGRALISQGDAFIVAPNGDHGINFTGGDGTLGIQNGDVVYVGSDGHVDLKSTDGIASDGLTEGFTTDSNNVLQWAQGEFFACPHVSLRSGVTLSSDCVQIGLTKVAA